MKFTHLADTTAYRVHQLRWAYVPTSGAGAAKHGGRVNRPGVEALYLALDVATAVGEYQRLSSLLPPGTLTSYQLSIDKIADFTAGYDAALWSPVWQDFYCNWRELWFNQEIEPSSWAIGDEVVAVGGKGILFRSALREGGINLVIYNAMLDAGDALKVYDPDNALTKSRVPGK